MNLFRILALIALFTTTASGDQCKAKITLVKSILTSISGIVDSDITSWTMLALPCENPEVSSFLEALHYKVHRYRLDCSLILEKIIEMFHLIARTIKIPNEFINGSLCDGLTPELKEMFINNTEAAINRILEAKRAELLKFSEFTYLHHHRGGAIGHTNFKVEGTKTFEIRLHPALGPYDVMDTKGFYELEPVYCRWGDALEYGVLYLRVTVNVPKDTRYFQVTIIRREVDETHTIYLDNTAEPNKNVRFGIVGLSKYP